MFLLLDAELDTPLESNRQPLYGGKHYNQTAHDQLDQRQETDQVTEQHIPGILELVDGVGGQDDIDKQDDSQLDIFDAFPPIDRQVQVVVLLEQQAVGDLLLVGVGTVQQEPQTVFIIGDVLVGEQLVLQLYHILQDCFGPGEVDCHQDV